MRGGTTRRGQVLRRGREKALENGPKAWRSGFTIRHCDDELYWARVTLLNIDDSVEVVEVSGFFGGSSCTARFPLPRLRGAEGLTTDAGTSSAFMERGWRSHTVVSQVRSLSSRTAQFFAAAAASASGPATSRNCMPSPLLLSFTTMIGRNAASGAFDFDLRRPRHSARRPPSELALPTSTPNSVRWTATLGGSRSATSPACADATTSGIGDAVIALIGVSDGINFPAGASGGASIDFEAISGVAGVTAGEFLGEFCGACAWGAWATGETAAGLESFAGAVSAGGFSAGFAGAAATGDTTGAGAGFCDAGCGGSGVAGAVVAACGRAGAEFCRAIAPVTVSSPCSRTVTRAYNRSRSLLSVSIAEASRRASLWLSLATDWICCDWSARSADVICSRRNPIDDWLASTATMMAPIVATPHDPSRHSARRSM